MSDMEASKKATPVTSAKATPATTDPEVQVLPEDNEPQLISPEEAMKRAVALHEKVEKAMVDGLKELDGDRAWHEEMATARGSIQTLLWQLRAGWPGGKKVVTEE